MRKMSTGQDSTLGNWLSLSAAFFGDNSGAVEFLRDKIAKAEKGEQEEVIADERQLLHFLAHCKPKAAEPCVVMIKDDLA